jgi:hypothetical protein
MSASRRKPSIAGAFIPHTLEMRQSPAWRALPDVDRRVLDRLEVEHMQHGGKENGRLICTYDQLAKAGIRRASLALAIRQLIALGFVRITERGGRAIADVRQPARYRLTYPLGVSRLEFGSDKREEVSPTHDWRLIATDQAAAEALSAVNLARNARTQSAAGKNKFPDALPSPAPDAPVRLVDPNFRTRPRAYGGQ